LGIDRLIAVGAPEYLAEHSFKEKSESAELVEHFSRGDVVLIKASRSERFEELAEMIINKWREIAPEEIGESE
jgi:UDP-N-acetylmuramoyl-tripeptide--D-alanyl-D-alanine ligase